MRSLVFSQIRDEQCQARVDASLLEEVLELGLDAFVQVVKLDEHGRERTKVSLSSATLHPGPGSRFA